MVSATKSQHAANLASLCSVRQNDRLRGSLRAGCWLAALILGAASAWTARFTMYPDGVSYLDIGDAYWRGDWHNAINGYWSPLYSWILGFFLKIFKPSIFQEYPLVHLVNFLVYVVALRCFDFFLCTFIDQRTNRDRELVSGPGTEMPPWGWIILGYSAFVTSSLFLVTISFVSGDMIIAAIIYFASALILKIQRGHAPSRSFASLGLVLGLGYLAKTVMFLMALPFLAVAALSQDTRAQKIRGAAISLLFFFVAVGPFVFLLSKAKGRPTFGDSGRINYAMNVGTTQFFIPDEPAAKHRVRKLDALGEAYEYSHPIGGTYPLWYDPSYWHEGIQPHFDLLRQVRTLLLAAAECLWISFNIRMGLSITVAIFFLYLVAPSIRRCFTQASLGWVLWVPAIIGIAIYSPVVIEPRYVAAPFCLLWIVGFSGVGLPADVSLRRLTTGTVLAVAAMTCLVSGWQIERAFAGRVFAQDHVATPICPRIAQALTEEGIRPGDQIAIISNWLFPSREGAYIARLARARIIAEARPDEFWSAAPSTRSHLELEFAHAGARAILTYNPWRVESGWKRLSDTDYYFFRLGGG